MTDLAGDIIGTWHVTLIRLVSSMELQSTLVTTVDVESGLSVVSKCYTVDESARNTSGITLLFTHCVGSHKEQWEPTIQHMFDIQQLKDEKYRIREAWSFDWQNHGDAAVLNREALKTRPGGVSVHEWAHSIAAFASSLRMKGHRMVAIGHSAGAGAIMLSTKDSAPSKVPFAALVLVEPAMVSRELFYAHYEDRMATMDFTVRVTSARRDKWESHDAAFEYFKKRFPWSSWDTRVVRLLADYGLQGSSPCVSLKCDRLQEAVSYTEKESHFDATTLLGHICHAVPVHVVWGTENDLM
ncbi:hypothetical protein DXG01_015602 [Tephrocybe rancida]|nr:hypothetical protein DXG01_015602 [Tephrocybe rancida]